MLRYKLSALFLVITILAVCLSAWRRYVTPNLGGIRIDGRNIELMMTDQYIQRACSDDPYYVQSLLGPTRGGVPLLDHAHIWIPLHLPLVAMAILVCVTGGACFAIKWRSAQIGR